ncbi:MAG TPA: putative phage tail protein [Methylophilaceae bacterium]|nr:putative phage tail protein [Methylophilaceae bacterium]
MALETDDYLAQLRELLPPGPAWPRDNDSLLTKLLTGWAEEFARIDARADDLVDEADPRTTSELLPDWERVVGLPDPCVTVNQSVDQRRAALVSKLTSIGGQSRQYFLDLAFSLGYIGSSIEEYRPFNCTDDCNDALYSELDRFVWTLFLPSNSGIYIMNCNSACNSPLQAWGDEVIECRVNRYKPAHTKAIFAYP